MSFLKIIILHVKLIQTYQEVIFIGSAPGVTNCAPSIITRQQKNIINDVDQYIESGLFHVRVYQQPTQKEMWQHCSLFS